MLIERKINHPLHMVNYYRRMVKQALRAYVLQVTQPVPVPQLDRDLEYYFVFETHPKESENVLLYGITCFDSDGIILFNISGTYPVSLWRFRRQGVARTFKTMEGLIKSTFKRKNVPLLSDAPFNPVADGVYHCNISWHAYNLLTAQ